MFYGLRRNVSKKQVKVYGQQRLRQEARTVGRNDLDYRQEQEFEGG